MKKLKSRKRLRTLMMSSLPLQTSSIMELASAAPELDLQAAVRLVSPEIRRAWLATNHVCRAVRKGVKMLVNPAINEH